MPAPRHPPPRHPPPRQASAELVSIGTAAVISTAVRAVVRSSFIMPSCTRRLSDGTKRTVHDEFRSVRLPQRGQVTPAAQRRTARRSALRATPATLPGVAGLPISAEALS